MASSSTQPLDPFVSALRAAWDALAKVVEQPTWSTTDDALPDLIQAADAAASAVAEIGCRLVAEAHSRRLTSKGWLKRRPLEDGLDDLETTIQCSINCAPISIWNLDRLDDYLALLAEVRFSGDWLEPLRTGRLHPWRPADPASVLRDLGQPILILHGAQDMTFPVQLAQQLHKAVPTSKLEILDQAGHMAQFEQPDRWSEAVDEFLSD